MEAHAHTPAQATLDRFMSKTMDGIRLVGDRVNSAQQQPSVILAHGFGQTRQSWFTTQQRLAQLHIGSLACDMRAHGESDRNPDSRAYQIEQFVDDAVHLAQQLAHKPHKPILVGASMGGLTGLMAQAKADVFSALVLVDVTPRWEAAGMQRILGFMNAFPDGFDSYDHAADVIANYLPHRRERKSNSQLQFLLRPENNRLHWHWDRRLLTELTEFVDTSDRLQENTRAAAKNIDVPVLLISGGKSDLVSTHTVNDFLTLVPHATHRNLSNATHMVAGDDNDTFSDTLIHFLQTQFPSLSLSTSAATGVSP
jgi:pimeloyl-ACP methyl ester carboxylesterase